MNLTSNPATIAFLSLEIDIKLILRIKIEKFQRGVFAEKVGGFNILFRGVICFSLKMFLKPVYSGFKNIFISADFVLRL